MSRTSTLVEQAQQHAARALRFRGFTSQTQETPHTLGCSLCLPHACECEAGGACSEEAESAQTAPPRKSTQQQSAAPHAAALSPEPASLRETMKPKEASVAAAQQRRRSEQLSHAAAGSDVPPPSSALLSSLPPCTRCMQPFPSPLHTTIASNAANTCRFCKVLTAEELAAHNKPEAGLWLCISGRVYDLTKWAPSHPGGLLPILNTAGADCTDVFRVFHSEEIASTRLPAFHIGVMGRFDQRGRLTDNSEWKETPMQKDFHQMIRQLEADGLFRTSYLWYCKKVAGLLALLASAVWLLLISDSRALPIIASSFLLGLFWQQLAFMGHDLGHNSVRGSASSDWAPGLVVTMLFGVSVQWWKRSHNVHHVVTNSLEHDCDIQYLPVFALSERMLRKEGFFSSYHARLFQFDWLSSFLVRWQHVLYWPVMGIARANLYVQSIALVWDSTKAVPHRNMEKFALIVFWCWHLTLLYMLPDNATRLAYYTLAHWVAGLTHVQITLSHFAMPVHEDTYTASSLPEAREHFLRSQFATTMDVSCSEWMDWLHGGLQFQLTHHLLPKVPRHHLRECREKYVKPFALRNGLDYKSESFWEANKTVYRRMKTAADASRLVRTTSPFKDTLFGQFLNSDG